MRKEPLHGVDWWLIAAAGIVIALCAICAAVMLAGLAGIMLFGFTVASGTQQGPQMVTQMVTVVVTRTPIVVTAAPEPEASPEWKMVINDTFDSNINMWHEDTFLDDRDRSRISLYIEDGELIWEWTNYPGLVILYETCWGCEIVEDSHVSVDVTIVDADPLPGQAGVMVRQRHGASFYACLVNTEGEVAAGRRDAESGEWTYLHDWEAHSSIDPDGTNTVALRIEGQQLTCFVNDEQVLTFTDSVLVNGRPGVVAGLGPSGGAIEVVFDNFQVIAPVAP